MRFSLAFFILWGRLCRERLVAGHPRNFTLILSDAAGLLIWLDQTCFPVDPEHQLHCLARWWFAREPPIRQS
jgi:hypothetical protein